MGLIKGQNLRISVGGKYIAAARSCSIHVAQSLEDSSTKDSTGDFGEQEVTGLSWDASSDCLVESEADEAAEGGFDLMDACLAKTLVTISFDMTSGDKNRTKGTVRYTGTAYVNDVTVTAENKQNSTVSAKFTGSGALTKGAAA
jgi:hypothetical protein